ncbi:MAG: hypothetical protein JWM55_1304 [Acidimicrobiaceae bacterium]|nr:hypothetical protein [Acidimicrobiaceae bacterium]
MPPILVGLADYFAKHREAEPAFTAYRNYVEDLERIIALDYGSVEERHAAIVAATRVLPAVAKLTKRTLTPEELADVKKCLERAWGMLRAMWVPLDLDEFITEFNSTIPITSYYAAYHALLATTAATSHRGNTTHRATLNDASALVGRQLLPWPWSSTCEGCPQLGEETFKGFARPIDEVHVFTALSDDELPHRLGGLLKSTRDKELGARFDNERKRIQKVNRKNLKAGEKRKMASGLAPTTIFDVLRRIREKANYEGADVFVLGAPNSDEARRFGAPLITVVDATIVALETLVDRAVGDGRVATWLEAYNQRSGGVACLKRHLDALS